MSCQEQEKKTSKGGLNIADRLEQGNFEWDGETALDLLDIAGGLAVGTGTVLTLGSKAAKITQLKNAVLISGGIETGTDLTGGVILSAQHYRRIEEIRNSNLSEEQKQAQIQQELISAAGTGGLILLGAFVPGRVKGKKGDFLDIDSSGFTTSGKGSLSISAEELKELRAVGLSNDEFKRLQDPNLSKADREALIDKHQKAFAKLVSKFDQPIIEVLIQRLGAKELRRIYGVVGNKGLRTIADVIELEKQGLIRNFDDWASFFKTEGWQRTNENIQDLLSELQEAKRLSGNLKQGEVIDIGGDARAKVDASGNKLKSFDMKVENVQTGKTTRNIEVKTLEDSVDEASDVTEGIKHAIEKRVDATEGTVEATIQMELATRVNERGGRTKLIDPSGNYSVFEPDGINSYITGNIFQDIKTNIALIDTRNHHRIRENSGVNLIDRVNLVRKDGSLFASYFKENGEWKLKMYKKPKPEEEIQKNV